MHNYPVLLDCNFVVDSTNGNGLGIRSLKGPGIQAVYMHTSSTPAAGSPNPAAGYILVQLQDNFQRSYGGWSGWVAPLSGSDLTSGLTVGVPYTISTLGSSTLAQWQTAGLPVGITPAVGVAFFAAATSIAGGGAVQLAVTPAIDSIAQVGNANLTIQSSAKNVPGVSSGSYVVLRASLSGTLAAPADGTVISLKFYFSNSKIMVQGE